MPSVAKKLPKASKKTVENSLIKLSEKNPSKVKVSKNKKAPKSSPSFPAKLSPSPKKKRHLKTKKPLITSPVKPPVTPSPKKTAIKQPVTPALKQYVTPLKKPSVTPIKKPVTPALKKPFITPALKKPSASPSQKKRVTHDPRECLTAAFEKRVTSSETSPKKKLKKGKSKNGAENKKKGKEIKMKDKVVDKKKKKELPIRHMAIPKGRGVVLIKHLPHGFYENQLKAYFSQFGSVTRVRVSRSKRTGGSKGFAYVEFVVPEVAEIAAETMNNYLMFKKKLETTYIPPEEQKFNYFRSSVKKIMVNGVEQFLSSDVKKRENLIIRNNRPVSSKLLKERTRAKIAKIDKMAEKLKSQGIIIDPDILLGTTSHPQKLMRHRSLKKKQRVDTITKLKEKKENKKKQKVKTDETTEKDDEKEDTDKDDDTEMEEEDTESEDEKEENSNDSEDEEEESDSDEDEEEDEITHVPQIKKANKLSSKDAFEKLLQKKTFGGIEKNKVKHNKKVGNHLKLAVKQMLNSKVPLTKKPLKKTQKMK